MVTSNIDREYGVDDLIEVKLTTPDDFLRIKETLTRIGLCSNKTKTLYQSCHILHKRQKYYILHFKELFALDGKPFTFSDEDQSRRNTIIRLLEDWKLCEIVDTEYFDTLPQLSIKKIKIIPFKDKKDWTLVSKYSIGS